MTWTINPVRGEVGLPLDGKLYPMLPTYEAHAAIEAQLGSVLSLSRRMLDTRLGLPPTREVAIIAYETMREAGRDRKDPILQKVEVEVLARKIYAAGLLDLMPYFSEVLANMISGGTTPKKKDETTAESSGSTSEST